MAPASCVPVEVDAVHERSVSSSPRSTGQNAERMPREPIVRLMSCRSAAGEILGIVEGERWLPAATLLASGPRTIADLLAAGPDAPAELREAAAAARIGATGRPLGEADLLAPVPRPGKVVAIGRNYREHAEEEGVEPPTAPLIFSKWPSSVVGHGADIRWDAGPHRAGRLRGGACRRDRSNGSACRRRRRPRARARLHLPQ